MGMSSGNYGVQQAQQQMPGYGPGESSNMNYGQQGQYNTMAQDMSRNVMGQMDGGMLGSQQQQMGQPGMMYAGGSPGWAGGGGMGGGMGGPQSQYSPYGNPYQNNQYGFGSSYSPFQGQGGRYGPPQQQMMGGGMGGRYGGFGGGGRYC